MYEYKKIIAKSGRTIYDSFVSGSEALYIPSNNLTQILTEGLVGMDLNGIALRTRSKIVKAKICEILGYPIPKSFKKNSASVSISEF